MDQNGRNFGRGPRELTGAVDLISRFKLVPHHKFFCKRALPNSIKDSHYLKNIVGEKDIMRGEGMELDQLRGATSASYVSERKGKIETFDLETLGRAFQLRETAPVRLPTSEKGTPTISCKVKSEEEREKKEKRKREKEEGKEREHKKHKHHHKENGKEKEKEKENGKEIKREKEIKKQANGHFTPVNNMNMNDPTKRQNISHGIVIGNSQQKRNFGGNNQDLSGMQKHRRVTGLLG